MKYEVIHNKKEHRFETSQNGHLAMVKYQLLDKEIMNIYHTEVPESIGGKGVGTAILKEALEFALKNHYRVLPTCPFAREYLRKHTDYQDIFG